MCRCQQLVIDEKKLTADIMAMNNPVQRVEKVFSVCSLFCSGQCAVFNLVGKKSHSIYGIPNISCIIIHGYWMCMHGLLSSCFPAFAGISVLANLPFSLVWELNDSKICYNIKWCLVNRATSLRILN